LCHCFAFSIEPLINENGGERFDTATGLNPGVDKSEDDLSVPLTVAKSIG
jgi:hypothetical protein